jgi:hypothetical protein
MIDGIYQGDMSPYKKNSGVIAGLNKTVPSATRFSEGVFGAGRTPEGMGDGSGMKKASDADGSTKKGMPRKTARRAYE